MKRILTILILAGGALAQTAATDAIDALRGLQSVTEIGVNFRDYSTRVADAKVKVDKYLADAPKDDPARAKIADAMQFYVLAMQAWNPGKTADVMIAAGKALEQDPVISACPGVADAVATWAEGARKNKLPMRTDQQRWGFYGTLIGSKPGILWKCAAGKFEGLK